METKCNSIYISGPITGLKEEDAKAAFDKAEKLLEIEYERVVNPMRFEAAYQSAKLTYDEMMDIDLRLLKMCKAIYMLKKLGRFKGCMYRKINGVAVRNENHIRRLKGSKSFPLGL